MASSTTFANDLSSGVRHIHGPALNRHICAHACTHACTHICPRVCTQLCGELHFDLQLKQLNVDGLWHAVEEFTGGYLSVQIVRAQLQLPPQKEWGGTGEVYATIKVGAQEAQQTSRTKAAANPEWDEIFCSILPLSRHRQRHVHCAAIGTPVLKRIASPRRSF